ncbi:MAG: zf-HC2 domain-containing protein [Desulfomonilaceae bacterium]
MKTLECNEAERLIIAELDEGLGPPQQERLESHLCQCAHCREAREDTLALLSAIASDLPEDPGEEFWKLYYQSLDARLKEKELKPVWFSWWKAAGALIAAVVALIIIHVSFFQPVSRPIADRRIMSPDLIQELQQIYGPVSEEYPRVSVSSNQLLGRIDARGASLDERDLQWLDVEDDPGPLYL